MVLTTKVGPGRPYQMADIPFRMTEHVRLQDAFYNACAPFHYKEIVAISRALRVSERTVWRWKYQETFPRYDMVMAVIDWVARGKPIIKMSPSQSIIGMP